MNKKKPEIQSEKIWSFLRREEWQVEIWDAPWPTGPFGRKVSSGVAVLSHQGMLIAVVASPEADWDEKQLQQAADPTGAPLIIRAALSPSENRTEGLRFEVRRRFGEMWRDLPNFIHPDGLLQSYQDQIFTVIAPNLCQQVTQAVAHWQAGLATRIHSTHGSAIDA